MEAAIDTILTNQKNLPDRSRNCSDVSWNSTGEIGRIGRHRPETHRYFNIRFFGQMSPDAPDFPGGIPAVGKAQKAQNAGL